MSNELQNKAFHNETKAREWLESHLWPDGPVCGRCGSVNDATSIETRPGLYQCNAAEWRSQFTVTVGTLFEPEGGAGASFAKFSCSTLSVNVTGAIIGESTPTNTLSW